MAYTQSQKAAIYRWRNRNREKYLEYIRTYYYKNKDKINKKKKAKNKPRLITI